MLFITFAFIKQDGWKRLEENDSQMDLATDACGFSIEGQSPAAQVAGAVIEQSHHTLNSAVDG